MAQTPYMPVLVNGEARAVPGVVFFIAAAACQGRVWQICGVWLAPRKEHRSTGVKSGLEALR